MNKSSSTLSGDLITHAEVHHDGSPIGQRTTPSPSAARREVKESSDLKSVYEEDMEENQSDNKTRKKGLKKYFSVSGILGKKTKKSSVRSPPSPVERGLDKRRRQLVLSASSGSYNSD